MKVKVSTPVETLSELQQIIGAIPGATIQEQKRQESGGLKMKLKDWVDVLVTFEDFAELLTALIALHTAWSSTGKPETSIGVSTPVAHSNVTVGGSATPASI